MPELNASEIVAKHTYGTWRPQKGWKPITVTKAEGKLDGQTEKLVDEAIRTLTALPSSGKGTGHGTDSIWSRLSQ